MDFSLLLLLLLQLLLLLLVCSAVTVTAHLSSPKLQKFALWRRNVAVSSNALLPKSFCISDGIEHDEVKPMYFDEESSKSPLEKFLFALESSIKDQTLVKVTISENNVSFDLDVIIEENSVEQTDSDYDWEYTKELAAISGRLVKTKSESKVQLTCHKDKSMKKSDRTVLYSASDAVSTISGYITRSFKKAMLSTKYSDFELKMRKGVGKFRETSKVRFESYLLFFYLEFNLYVPMNSVHCVSHTNRWCGKKP